MQHLQTNNIIFKLIASGNILFVTLFVVLCYYNRIASDDFYSLALLREQGIADGVFLTYNTWTGRWAACFLNLFVISFYSFKYILFVYGLLVFSLLIFSVKRLLHNLTALFQLNLLGFWKELNYSVFIVSALFYSTIKIDETWFFLSSTCVYLVSILFFILGTSAIIHQKNGIGNILLLIISFAYIGGSCEPFALITLVFLSILIFLNDFGMLKFNLQKKQFAKNLIIALIVCLGSFIILYMANGNTIRGQFFKDITIAETFLLNFKTTGMIILLRIPFILPYIIVFTLPAYYMGSLKTNAQIIKKETLTRIVKIALFYFFLLYIYQFPITYITQDIGAYRALFPVTIFTLISAALIFYNLGLAEYLNATNAKYILIFSLATICFINIFTLIGQLKITPAYAKAYDARIEFLNQNNQNKNTMNVASLPNSGLLYSAEISSDTAHFTNQHLKKGLQLKAAVRLIDTIK